MDRRFIAKKEFNLNSFKNKKKKEHERINC